MLVLLSCLPRRKSEMSDVRERTRLDGEESVGGMVRAKETTVSDWDREMVGVERGAGVSELERWQ